MVTAWWKACAEALKQGRAFCFIKPAATVEWSANGQKRWDFVV